METKRKNILGDTVIERIENAYRRVYDLVAVSRHGHVTIARASIATALIKSDEPSKNTAGVVAQWIAARWGYQSDQPVKLNPGAVDVQCRWPATISEREEIAGVIITLAFDGSNAVYRCGGTPAQQSPAELVDALRKLQTYSRSISIYVDIASNVPREEVRAFQSFLRRTGFQWFQEGPDGTALLYR